MTALTRFLGGSPAAVALKLLVVSLLVGWFLSWLAWSPFEVWLWLRGLALDAWLAAGTFVDYILIGAVIVVPVFLVLRLVSYRGSRG